MLQDTLFVRLNPKFEGTIWQFNLQMLLTFSACLCACMLCVCCVAMQELRKASGQQLREVQVVQGEVSKQLQDERYQAERKEAQLRVSTNNQGILADRAQMQSCRRWTHAHTHRCMQVLPTLQALLACTTDIPAD
jgi:UDP-2,3-diacylglucosamine pyrophosphatase LpxH